MLSVKDHLLVCLGEECGEVQQLVGKSLRFGMMDVNPDNDEQNWIRLQEEVHDIITVYEMLCEEMNTHSTIGRTLVDFKKVKIDKCIN